MALPMLEIERRLQRLEQKVFGIQDIELDDQFTPERIAQQFHATYERLAPDFGYRTREESAKPWEEVPLQNRALMIAVVSDLLQRGVIVSS